MKALIALLLAALPLAASAAEPRPFVRGSWSELRQAHRDHPTVIHFWGLTCGPCLVELPDWSRFAQDLRGIDIVMIAADPVAVAPADLASTLEKAGLGTLESWRFADPFTERLEYEIDPQWRGELPYTLLIGRDGSIQPILGTVDFAQLRAWSERQSRRAAAASDALP